MVLIGTLGAFRSNLGAFEIIGFNGDPWGPWEALGALTKCPKLILIDGCNEINGFKLGLGDLWKHRVGLWKRLGALACSPKLVWAYSCNEITGFKGGPWVRLEATGSTYKEL